jgi:hypothetical protein
MQATPLSLQVVLDPDVGHPLPDAVCFRTGPAVEGQPTYEDLEPFVLDLVSGRPLPLKFVTRRVDDERTILAAALFLNRDLPIHPRMPVVLAAAALWRDFPAWGLSHVDRDLGRFLGFLRAAVPPSGLDRRTLGTRLSAAVAWVRDYVRNDVLPPLPPMPMPDVLDVGTNGFVVAQTSGPLDFGWVDLFRMGHLRGVLADKPVAGRRRVRVSRKSQWAALNLDAACQIFNEMEAAMGQPPGWHVQGDALDSQIHGTEIALEHLILALVRC